MRVLLWILKFLKAGVFFSDINYNYNNCSFQSPNMYILCSNWNCLEWWMYDG
jgi:hypothetical protein